MRPRPRCVRRDRHLHGSRVVQVCLRGAVGRRWSPMYRPPICATAPRPPSVEARSTHTRVSGLSLMFAEGPKHFRFFYLCGTLWRSSFSSTPGAPPKPSPAARPSPPYVVLCYARVIVGPTRHKTPLHGPPSLTWSSMSSTPRSSTNLVMARVGRSPFLGGPLLRTMKIAVTPGVYTVAVLS